MPKINIKYLYTIKIYIAKVTKYSSNKNSLNHVLLISKYKLNLQQPFLVEVQIFSKSKKTPKYTIPTQTNSSIPQVIYSKIFALHFRTGRLAFIPEFYFPKSPIVSDPLRGQTEFILCNIYVRHRIQFLWHNPHESGKNHATSKLSIYAIQGLY